MLTITCRYSTAQRRASLTQALEFLGQRLRKYVVSAHRVADLDRTAGEPVDLGRLAWEPTPALCVEISERNQALQVLERNRAVDVGFASYLLDASRFAVGMEPEQDVATGEVSKVEFAGAADEALDKLGKRLPSLILMDIQLPGQDGLSLTRQLKAFPTTANIPIIALTAHAMISRAPRSRRRISGG
jgi:CheY-like chemotaxis protein